MEFLKGGGKTFEIARTLANWVRTLGGEESHVLRILQPNDLVARQIGSLLARTAFIVERPARFVALDKEAGCYTRITALKAVGDVELAMSLLRDETECSASLKSEAIRLISLNAKERREELLLEIALMPDGSRASEAACHLDKTSQDYLLKIALEGQYAETRCYAAGRLDEAHLQVAATFEHWDVRVKVADHLSDLAILRSLAQSDVDSMVRNRATKRLAELEQVNQ